ncbi:MAG: replication-relaxation family protein [Deltaproteobacteria bacterium]|nr:replication-relaxation family protein [Deltaproteobacteria bacterium]
MARVKGAVLTARDRVLLSYLAIARYASTLQLHRLLADGHDISLVYRRLRRLSADMNRPGESPPVRRLAYRRAEGTAVAVWALTQYGRAVAEDAVPYLRPPGKADVSARFLLHTLMLNDVLVELVLALRQSPEAPLAELPFRWLCENDEQLGFSVFRQDLGQTRASILKPDAILELPGPRRRLFVEAETGAHSIATADPLSHGAVLKKLERYARFITGLVPGSGPTTFYEAAFSDGLAPELVLLVHSEGRKAKVEAAIREWSRGRGVEELAVRVLTFRGAAAEIVSLLGGQAALSRGPRLVTIDDHRARRLREGFNAVAEALNAARRAVAEHNGRCGDRLVLPPAPMAELKDLRDLIKHDLLGEPRSPRGETGVVAR